MGKVKLSEVLKAIERTESPITERDMARVTPIEESQSFKNFKKSFKFINGKWRYIGKD